MRWMTQTPALPILVLAGLAAACANEHPLAHEDIWSFSGPIFQQPVLYWFVPDKPPMAAEQAIEKIKKFQSGLLSPEGKEIIQMDADADELRLKSEWTASWRGELWVGTSTLTWYGPGVMPVYFAWERKGEQKVTIPISKVAGVEIGEMQPVPCRPTSRSGPCPTLAAAPATPKPIDAWVRFDLGDNKRVGVLVRELDSAKALANAVAALAAAHGKNLAPVGHIGIMHSNLTPMQQQDLAKSGIASGTLVIVVFKGGPAEQAGVKKGDVILAINGVPATSVAQVNGLIRASGPRVELNLGRWGSVSDVHGNPLPGWTKVKATVSSW